MRVVERILQRDIRQPQALQADRNAFQVHHLEHSREAAVFFADQVARRIVEDQRAGRGCLDAHLVLDRRGLHGVALTKRAIVINEKLRHQEEADTPRPGRRAIHARDHEVQDVFSQVMVTRRYEDLLAT